MNLRAIDWTGEPYRWFFPLGIIAGTVGVTLWPLWVGGLLDTYPALAHARIMIEGFFLAFIFGFLGTAGPRLIEVRSFSRLMWTLVLCLWTFSQMASLAQAHNLAESATIGALLIFTGQLVQRFPYRNDLPPPGFVLVLLSLFLAIPAAATQMPALQAAFPDVSPLIWLSGRAFITEGFVLLPILGAAPFFFGRFGGLPPRHVCPESRHPTRAWMRQSAFVSVVAAMLLLCLIGKAAGYVRAAAAAQCAITLVYIATQVPFRYSRGATVFARLAQIALLTLVLAPLAEAVWPGQRMAWRHLLFIPGFQFTVVAVATWVVFAHAGHKERLRRPWKGMIVLATVWLVALGSRLGAEWNPSIRDPHLVYAAVLWIGASVVWLSMLLPRLRESD